MSLGGQLIWTSRFVLQWLASERRGESHFPVYFWWLSLLGNGMLLATPRTSATRS
ncbi:MAG: lipid-A-disaccharide synthase N-terminal domain-containing protein [Planctomycetota bacterium]